MGDFTFIVSVEITIRCYSFIMHINKSSTGADSLGCTLTKQTSMRAQLTHNGIVIAVSCHSWLSLFKQKCQPNHRFQLLKSEYLQVFLEFSDSIEQLFVGWVCQWQSLHVLLVLRVCVCMWASDSLCIRHVLCYGAFLNGR